VRRIRVYTWLVTRLVLGLVLAAALCAVASPAAGAAERQVPERFFGVMWDGDIQDAPASLQSAQWPLMAQSGVETARAMFNWEVAQPKATRPPSFAYTDALVAGATAHGVELLPIVHHTPRWARLVKHRASVPRNVDDYVRYVTALVQRYGPNGSFWAEHPELPAQPIRVWQIWNEPQLHWQLQPHEGWQKRYGKMLRESTKAIRAIDPGARVVLAGLANRAWDAIAKLYSHGGIAGHYDIAALHMYSSRAGDFPEVLRRFRKALDRVGARDVPIWVTEVGASASRGAVKAEPAVRYLQTTHKGMAKLISTTFRNFAGVRAKYGLERVYWYTWTSAYTVGSYVFGWSGLNVYAKGQVLPMYALTSYRNVARELEGCKKDAQARCLP
jgi:hypothetical protein